MWHSYFIIVVFSCLTWFLKISGVTELCLVAESFLLMLPWIFHLCEKIVQIVFVSWICFLKLEISRTALFLKQNLEDYLCGIKGIPSCQYIFGFKYSDNFVSLIYNHLYMLQTKPLFRNAIMSGFSCIFVKWSKSWLWQWTYVFKVVVVFLSNFFLFLQALYIFTYVCFVLHQIWFCFYPDFHDLWQLSSSKCLVSTLDFNAEVLASISYFSVWIQGTRPLHINFSKVEHLIENCHIL